MALRREGLDEIARIGTLDGAGRRQNGDEAGTGALRRRFDGGYCSDKGHLRKPGTQIGTGKREGGIAGNDADFRAEILQQFFKSERMRALSASSSQPP